MEKDTFKSIEKIVNDYSILKGKVSDGEKEIGAVFTTSEEMDIRELISDGLSVEEIIEVIKEW
jgi:DNA-binding NarL/FixJ family response regulator